MTNLQKIGDAFIKGINLILDSLERHRVRVLNNGICPICTFDPCACGTGTMAEVEGVE